MNFKIIASALALSSAMLLGGQAFAQTTINGMAVSNDDLPKVQERCDQLALADATKSATETPADDVNEDDSDDADDDTDANGAALINGEVEAVNEIADATSPIDLDTITLEACRTAGLVE